MIIVLSVQNWKLLSGLKFKSNQDNWKADGCGNTHGNKMAKKPKKREKNS